MMRKMGRMGPSVTGSDHTKKPRLFERQRHLLALLDALGGRVGNLDFQKLLFLYCSEPSVDDHYEFVPYRFGAFSFTSYADRRKLIERGYLEDDEKRWSLTEDGSKAVCAFDGLSLSKFAGRNRGLRGDALIAETYRRAPFYATRSEITERILEGDREALRSIEAARREGRTPRLATIGYEGRSLESYLNTLLRSGMSVLCDVRKNPISRKYGFSKKTLANGCERLGIRYEHLPELGITSEKRRNLKTQADYDDLFKDYRSHCLPDQQDALGKIKEWIRSGERVALTCYELLPEQCHRHCVAEALGPIAGRRIVPKHL